MGDASTALVVADDEAAAYPLLRFGRNQYSFPKEKAIVSRREALEVTYEEFVSFMGLSTSPSRSPDKWKSFLTVNNYGMVEVAEGRYPFCMFDVAGHPQMKHFIFFVPTDAAAKLLPQLHEEVSQDPEAHGIKINSAKTVESRAKHKARLDSLLWKPEDCQAITKSGSKKNCVPTPTANGWKVVPANLQLTICTADELAKQPKAKKTAGKRKADDEVEVSGVKIKTNVGFDAVSKLVSVDVGANYSTKVIDGTLHIVCYGPTAEVEDVEDEE